jgi:hypothetical protein
MTRSAGTSFYIVFQIYCLGLGIYYQSKLLHCPQRVIGRLSPRKKGLRQGDPISPYLFVLAIEILSRLLAESAIDKRHFGFHPRCQNLKLTHLCFANDLLIFIAVDMASITIVKNVLGEFE